jgi:hypothetical protein
MELRHLRYVVAVAAEAASTSIRILAALVPTGDTGTSTGSDQQPPANAAGGLTALAYELLDAHADTAQLADGLLRDPSWAAHLDYLRALQRKSRETLARVTAEELSPCGWTDSGSLDVR